MPTPDTPRAVSLSTPRAAPLPPTLLDLGRDGLETFLRDLGEPAYRAKQIWRAVHERALLDFASMTDLPAPLRDALRGRLRIVPGIVAAEQTSADGSTTKLLLRLDDGELVESVLMRYDSLGARTPRRTVCVSTQAGCAMGCVFCATGAQGFRRQLTAVEIAAQVLRAAQRSLRAENAAPLTHIVFMGMGEPLANYHATSEALTWISSPDGLAVSPRRVTVSTVGIVPGIRRLADDHPQVNLAVSLHAPDDALRRRLVPVPSASVREIVAAARDHAERTGRRVSFEYVLLAGDNDAPAQARALAALLHGVNAHVNLIPHNPAPGVEGRRPARHATLAFQSALADAGIATTVRVEKGRDIAAACGQLRGRAVEPAGRRNAAGD